MASSSKKWWLATGAVSVVVAGLMILGLPTCNRMVKEHQTDSEQKDSVAVVSNDDRVRALTDSINELKQDLRDTKEVKSRVRNHVNHSRVNHSHVNLSHVNHKKIRLSLLLKSL